jgi:glycosyltransferase involved in cell wall biosynthesis
MKLLLLHNEYGIFSGEEAVIYTQIQLLSLHGVRVLKYIRSSKEIYDLSFGKVRAFLNGAYSGKAIREVRKIIKSEKPDIVHIHNLYPFISPAILPVIKEENIPMVMTVHNYRLICPNGLFYNHTGICERCTGTLKELNCILFNCEDSLFKSTGYALRNSFARYMKYYKNNVDAYLCLTDFQKRKLQDNGFPPEKMNVLPNIYTKSLPEFQPRRKHTYIAYAGRISTEKGVDLIIKAAMDLPHVQFKLAGAVRDNRDMNNLPSNVIYCGVLRGRDLDEFYRNASAFVIPSICYEGFPMVLPEAMAYRLPVIASRNGGFPEIVENGYNGVLFSMGDHQDLIAKIKYIWENLKIAEELGQNGFKKLKKEYSPDIYYKKLVQVYNQVLHQNKK